MGLEPAVPARIGCFRHHHLGSGELPHFVGVFVAPPLPARVGQFVCDPLRPVRRRGEGFLVAQAPVAALLAVDVERVVLAVEQEG